MIDSHCHIDMPEFDVDRDEVVARARAAGLVEMLIVGGVDEAAGHRRALEVAARSRLPGDRGGAPARGAAWPWRRPTTSCAGWRARAAIVAIGEIGLDFHYDHSPRDGAARGLPPADPAGAGGRAARHRAHARGGRRDRAILEQEGAGEIGRCHPLLHRRASSSPAARSRWASTSRSPGSWRSRGRRRSSRWRAAAPRPAAGRDGRALPRASAAPRQAQRAGVRGRGGAQGGRRCGARAWRRSPGRRGATTRGCFDARSERRGGSRASA